MNFNEIKEIDEKYFFKVFGERQGVLFERGEGSYLYDSEGKKYIDFLGAIACVCLGHAHEGFNSAMKKQMDKFFSISNYFYNEQQAEFLKLLCETSGYDKAFICSSGAEANEAAIKLARKYFYNLGAQRIKIITAKNSFHGRTFATLAATGQEKFHMPYMPLTEKFEYIEFNDTSALDRAVNSDTCAVMLETIQGEGGVIPATKEFLKKAREVCDKTGALLILDEIQTGMGRTGKFLSAEHYEIKADITTLAKSLGNGFPLGAMLAFGEVANAFTISDHGSTFGGNALACTAGHYVISNIIQNNLLKRCYDMGEYFIQKLNLLKNKKSVLEIRGKGLIIGIELNSNLHSAASIQKELLNNGFIVCTAGRNTLRFLPNYYIEKENIDLLTDKLNEILT